jgi:hypothetical protein
MTRLACASLAFIFVAAAPPPARLPLPPIPPAHPPGEQLAPTPDRDAQAPWVPANDGVRVRPQDFRAQLLTQGLGYVPGSQFQSNEDRRPIQTPGLSLQVPLQ